MTNLTNPTALDYEKWSAQSRKAAAHLKEGKVKPRPGETVLRLGFAFDEPADETGVRIINLAIAQSEVERMTYKELAAHIYDTVLAMAKIVGKP